MSEQPLHSTFRDDPEMAELIEFFLDDLDERAGALREAMDRADIEFLRTIAHQLKGAAAGYGYPSITEAARELEQAVQRNEADLSAFSEQVESLVQLCRQAIAARSAA